MTAFRLKRMRRAGRFFGAAARPTRRVGLCPPKGAGGGFAAAGCRPENPLRCSENLYHKGHCVFIIDDVRKGIGTAVLAIDGPANGMT